jgi:Xaa-Pro aminopeptidase/Xaa-Pro dipeptidase
MKQRRKNLLKYAQKIDCDVLVTFEPENLFYMTGFWGEAIGLLEKNLKLEEQKKNLKIVM